MHACNVTEESVCVSQDLIGVWNLRLMDVFIHLNIKYKCMFKERGESRPGLDLVLSNKSYISVDAVILFFSFKSVGKILLIKLKNKDAVV